MFHLSTYLASVIAFLGVLTSIVIAAALYFVIEQSLTVEFDDKVRAESRELQQVLNNRLQRLENRLRALVQDNTVRVTMMLGAHQQLSEHLKEVYARDNDLLFIVKDARTGSTFTNTGVKLNKIESRDAFKVVGEGEFLFDIQPDGSEVKMFYSLPIYRQLDRVGVALVLYSFAQDDLLKSVISRGDSLHRVVLKMEDDFFDLITNEKITVIGDLSNIEETEIRQVTVAGTKNSVVACDALPNVYYFTTMDSIGAVKQQVFVSIVLPAIGVVIFVLLFTMILSRKLVQPIQRISDFALQIASGQSDVPLQHKDSRIIELNDLEESLLKMFRYLGKVRELERYQELFEGVADIVFIHDLEGKMVDGNTVAIEKFGFTKAQLVKSSLSDIVAKHHFDTIQKVLDSFRYGQEQLFFTTEMTSQSGEIFSVECHARQIVYDGKTVVLNVVRDVSDRVHAEEALQASQRTLHTVLDSIQATIYVADLDTYEVLFVNKYMKSLFGEKLEGKKCYQVFRNLAGPCNHCTNKKLLRNENKLSDVITREGQNPITGRWYLNHDRLVRWVDGRLARFQIAFDITESKTLEMEKNVAERQLRKIQKMEAIGALAGGVAHDLNNILTGVVSYPDLLLMQLPEESPLKQPLITIRDTGLRAAAIVQDLLTLARRGVVVNKVINLNDVVAEYIASPEHQQLMKEHCNVTYRIDLQPELFNILGSPIHLAKTIMNLVTNSAEAIVGEGTVIVSTSNEIIDEDLPAPSRVKAGEYVVVGVKDDGSGISAADREHIFEPFFTTKVMGRSGTGLGMAVVWGTVEDHEGYVDIASVEGVGTEFKLYFPVSRKQLLEEHAVLSDQEFSGHGESILVVDDVQEQREIASLMFSGLGYHVVTVATGEEAVEFIKENAVDLVILDMILVGGMNGLETYREILQLYPGQKAIITSGYSKTEHVTEAMQLGAGQYIRKPYLFKDIAKAVKTELL